MVRRWSKWGFLAAVAVPLLVWSCDQVQTIYWVGSIDLDVEFQVTDRATGNPIPGATVEVQSEGGFYEERDKHAFVLVADASGVARKECRNSMCFGTQSGLRFTDTFAVHLPWWRFRVVAPGFTPSTWANLDEPRYIQQARRVGPKKARLIVPLSLQKG
jgi:hypothetical protein